MAPSGASASATAAPSVGQGTGQTTASVSGQSGPSVSQANAPSVPPLSHELEQLADVKQSGTSDGHGHDQKPGSGPPESDPSSAPVPSPSDSVVLPQMQHADLQNVQQVRQHH